ncbi:thioredoxin family protein [Winogradskyella sp.]|uniref:DUF1223 domain-containing protein n=1 Tax=Winogradskyella sp. TaxID=1883156 RepID=UPI0025E1C4D9|nr:DUF1223 domain-containing protein [Winogradskyella sp.]
MKTKALTLFIIPFLLGTTKNIENDYTTDTNPVVLELFTSQGCSSCPPADELLKEVRSDNVIALSYHVDYWNYIGWKDPFSKKTFTDKQRKYGSKFYSSTIYTPQVVINGREHFVGSKQRLLQQKIQEYSKQNHKSEIIVSKAAKSSDYVTFDYNIENLDTNDNLRIVLVIDERKTSVKRGENRNRELINSNIVVSEQKFKLNTSKGKGSIHIPNIVEDKDDLTLVLILENNNLDIHTATQVSL